MLAYSLEGSNSMVKIAEEIMQNHQDVKKSHEKIVYLNSHNQSSDEV